MKGWGDREGEKEYPGGGGARADHWRSRMDLDSFFIVVYESRGGSGGGKVRVGTKCGLRSGREDRCSRRGRTRWVISSTGRCLRMFL